MIGSARQNRLTLGTSEKEFAIATPVQHQCYRVVRLTPAGFHASFDGPSKSLESGGFSWSPTNLAIVTRYVKSKLIILVYTEKHCSARPFRSCSFVIIFSQSRRSNAMAGLQPICPIVISVLPLLPKQPCHKASVILSTGVSILLLSDLSIFLCLL